MAPRREKEPFIHRGDKILITGGSVGGSWAVTESRWAKREDARDERIELILSRGSMHFKTIFNAETMRHQSNQPPDRLSRDINVRKPLQFRRK